MVRREWDSSNKDLSDMKYSPQQRKLKQEASVKATRAHRTESPGAQHKKDDILKKKKVNWKDWNLRESVDFDSEIEKFVPVVQVGSFHSSSVVNTQSVIHDANQHLSGTMQAQKDALRHLKNVITNSIPDNIEYAEPSNDTTESHEIDTDTSALFIKYILESKNKGQIIDSEISELKDLVSKLRMEYKETRDELDACQLIVSNHQQRIKELEVVVDSQNVIIKDQANLLIEHMSSKEVLENIRKSMSGIRF